MQGEESGLHSDSLGSHTSYHDEKLGVEMGKRFFLMTLYLHEKKIMLQTHEFKEISPSCPSSPVSLEFTENDMQFIVPSYAVMRNIAKQ